MDGWMKFMPRKDENNADSWDISNTIHNERNKTGNVCNVTVMRVRVTIVAVEKQ
jgi:hypothetical protein